MDDSTEVNILLLGDAECGKSTFLSRISQGPNGAKGASITLLKDMNQPFIFDIKLSATPYRFQLFDTASPENWTLLTPNIIVLCYDISSRLSLINTQRLWSKEIHRAFPDPLPVLLLGLKRDLRSETDPNGIIYPQEGYRVAQELRCDKYLECSAVSGELLGEVWEDVCRTAVESVKADGGGLSSGGCGVM
ncbi:Ras-like GTP-binding protein Rho1 [Lachnellula suecica]|uniref:Ras-like GTP-binding protein Rho1 n=1 Tax=Lachnellula suecica TaxID=602035 RepID=A0A8T9BW97_9HELO|nr:Ras-like GTP-binding protein Rho1 [Lachnellula suecica]